MKFFLNIFLCLIINSIDKSFEIENFSILFPFTTIPLGYPILNSTHNITIINNIMKNIYINDIYVKLELGSPPQKIYICINANSNDFFISKDIPMFRMFEEEYSKKNGSFYFDSKKSTTLSYQFEDRGHLYFSHSHLSEYVKDNFIFYSTKKNNNKILIQNFNFLLAYKVNGPNHGIIGLKGGIIENFKRDDIFTALKKNKLIKKYIWYLSYNENDKNNGSLIIGNYPHEDNNFNCIGKNAFLTKNNFRKVYSKIDSNSEDGQWGLNFNRIFSKNINVSPNINEEILDDCHNCKKVALNPSLGVVIGPNKYKYLLEDIYMNKFLDNKICFQSILNLGKNYEKKTYYYYYCNSSFIQQMKKEFNDIVFEHLEFEYNFSLTFDDLFIQKDKYIFSKIIFKDYHSTTWELGSPFISKYLFIFNSDSKEIGFYSINDKKIDDIKINNNKTFVNFIQKIIIGFLLIIIGIYIGKKLFGLRRKLRANELEEKFEYKPAEKGIQLL